MNNDWNNGEPPRSRIYANAEQQPYDDSYNYDKKPKKKKKGGMAAAVIAVAVAGAVAGSAITGFVVVPMVANQYLSNSSNATQVSTVAEEMPTIDEMPTQEESATAESSNSNNSGADEGTVVNVAEKVSESVVGVGTYQQQLVPGQDIQEQQVSSGSGFFISEDGYLLTNSHVVSSGNKYVVTMQDGTEYEARLVGQDATSDVAVLKVDADVTFSAVTLGDSTQVQAGEQVVAIGNPLGQALSNTVTVGYISAVSREVMLNDVKTEMLQTDAAINPGNSGGPLINMQGQVIGITTQKSIFAGTDAYGNAIPSEGIGFAIPISNAEVIANQLIETGQVSGERPGVVEEQQEVWPGIGINYGLVDEENAQRWGSPRGALVSYVAEGSPAAAAGLQVYDIITEMDGVDLTQGADMPSFEGKSVGDTVTAKVWRAGQELEMHFTLADLSEL